MSSSEQDGPKIVVHDLVGRTPNAVGEGQLLAVLETPELRSRFVPVVAAVFDDNPEQPPPPPWGREKALKIRPGRPTRWYDARHTFTSA